MRTPYILLIILALCMTAQALLGLIFSEQYRDVGYVRETWFANDWITLALAVPLFIVGLFLEQRSFVLGRLIWLGVLGYSVYNYAFYLFGTALNAFFPLYVIILVLSVSALILALSRTDVGAIKSRFLAKTPVRLIGGYLIFVALGNRWRSFMEKAWMGLYYSSDRGNSRYAISSHFICQWEPWL